jgi:hypothetical protein
MNNKRIQLIKILIITMFMLIGWAVFNRPSESPVFMLLLLFNSVGLLLITSPFYEQKDSDCSNPKGESNQ